MKSGLAHDGCRSDNKQAPEIAVSLFGYAAEFFLAPCRMLSRNEADPGCEIATGFERTRIGDGRGDRRRTDHADAGNAFEAPANIARVVLGSDRAIELTDLLAQGCELIEDDLQGVAHDGWQRSGTLLVGDDPGQLGQPVATQLGNQPKFGKMRSERIDQLCTLADQGCDAPQVLPAALAS